MICQVGVKQVEGTAENCNTGYKKIYQTADNSTNYKFN